MLQHARIQLFHAVLLSSQTQAPTVYAHGNEQLARMID
jgi:hypothetical protein